MTSKSRTELIEFLDYLGDKGLVPKSTVAARKAAANKILGILTEEEASDVTQLDIGSLSTRFANLHGKKYTANSLQTYVSRLRTAIDDFERYTSNPLNFKPSGGRPAARKSDNSSNGSKQNNNEPRDRRDVTSANNTTEPFKTVTSSILPIPIREDRVVQIHGLPFDLTEAEAKKIANVVTAMAQ